MHTTNDSNAFIEVADDCKAVIGTPPPEKADKTVAQLHFEMIAAHPYEFTSDEIIFRTYALRKQIEDAELETARQRFFDSSPKVKRACAPHRSGKPMVGACTSMLTAKSPCTAGARRITKHTARTPI
jgi:Family of unknown function (DUF6157)